MFTFDSVRGIIIQLNKNHLKGRDIMINKLLSAMPARLDGMLILSEVNRRYFTGFPSSDGVLLVTRGGSVFLTDSRYIEEALLRFKQAYKDKVYKR